jgi:bifunctional N-acetylglucosamine-1-phosphate-uridyltransferase/glucosamine-1-phosphate-acetyltransferase GlmU-like protein
VGKLKSSRGERGYVLLDVLATLAIALVGLAVCAGGLVAAGRLVVRQSERVLQIIEQRNCDEKSRTVAFAGD